MRTAAGLQLFFLRAQHHNALIGDTIEVDVSLSMPTGEAREARAYVDCRLAGDKSADCGKQQALEERSEEHTSELQSLMRHLVCRLLLEKKTNKTKKQR